MNARMRRTTEDGMLRWMDRGVDGEASEEDGGKERQMSYARYAGQFHGQHASVVV